MSKYKITIYAISKNEEKFVERWYNSVKDADNIVVLDTGSTDNTVELLKSLGVKVIQKIIDPWRFDVARNESLKLIPKDTDICVCSDLDEVFNENWREELEKIWNPDIKQVKYIYNWNHDENGKPIISFYYEKIHTLNDFIWVNPVHEILKYTKDNYKYVITDKIIVDHYQDLSKSRSNYLPLLELSVKENPENDRNMHYLGREYMYYHQYQEAIDTLIKHLDLKNATWKDERCASLRFIARSYKELKRYREAIMYGRLAIDEAPYLREPYVELAIIYLSINEYLKADDLLIDAINIPEKKMTYINEQFSTNENISKLRAYIKEHLT